MINSPNNQVMSQSSTSVASSRIAHRTRLQKEINPKEKGKKNKRKKQQKEGKAKSPRPRRCELMTQTRRPPVEASVRGDRKEANKPGTKVTETVGKSLFEDNGKDDDSNSDTDELDEEGNKILEDKIYEDNDDAEYMAKEIRQKYLVDNFSQQHAQPAITVSDNGDGGIFEELDDIFGHDDTINANNQASEDESETEDESEMEEDLPIQTNEVIATSVTPTSGSVAASSITNSDGSLNLTNIPQELNEKDLVKIVQKLNEDNIRLKAQNNSSKKSTIYNPLVETAVKNVVKNNLFPKVQFIRHDHLYNDCKPRYSIGRFVMDKCNIPENDITREHFWDSYKQIVRKQTKVQRNVVHTALKRKFFGK